MGEYVEKKFDSINVGDEATLTVIVTDEDVKNFAKVSRDTNPIHIDEEFAKNSMFGKRIAHGMLSASLISAVMGTDLPGINSIYISQTLQFRAPVFIGDELTAKVKVVNKREDKKFLTLETIVVNQDGTKVVVGEALVKKD